jgi:hypothetical protein
MPFATPQYSRNQVNIAARTVIERHKKSLADILLEVGLFEDSPMAKTYPQALEIVNNWRSSHSGPLLYLRMLLTKQNVWTARY